MDSEAILGIKHLAKAFVEENYYHPTPVEFMLFENAMMRAAIYVNEKQLSELKQGGSTVTPECGKIEV